MDEKQTFGKYFSAYVEDRIQYSNTLLLLLLLLLLLKNDLTIIYLQNHYSRRQWFSNSRRSNSSYLFPFFNLFTFLIYNGESLSTKDVLETPESINPSYLKKFVIIYTETRAACNNWSAMSIKYQACWHI